MKGDVTVLSLGGKYYKLELNGGLTPLDPNFRIPKGDNKMKYPEKNATMLHIGSIPFVLDEQGRLWGLWDYEWRRPGEETWKEGVHNCFLPVGDKAFEVRKTGGDKIYRVDKDGYELVEETPLDQMLKEIAERIDMLEFKDNILFALMSDKSANIGCPDLLNVLVKNDIVVPIHVTKERALYRLNKENVRVLPFFEQYKSRVKSLYEALVKP